MLKTIIGLLAAGQLALIFLAYQAIGGNYRGALLLLAGGVLILIALLPAALWRAQRLLVRNRHETLVAWINRIDVTADLLPDPGDSLKNHEPRLVLALQRMLGRLHKHRAQLRVEQQRTQSQLRNLTDVLYHTDRDGRLTWVTGPIIDMLGYAPKELFGLPLSRLLVNPDVDLPVLMHGEPVEVHPTRIKRKDGKTAWLTISTRPIFNLKKHVIGSEGVCRDATPLIEVQNRLNREQQRTQITLSAIGEGVITTDAEGLIDYVNPRGEQMLARTLSALRGRTFASACHLFDPGRQTFVARLVEECLSSGAARDYLHPLILLGESSTPPQEGDDYRSVTVSASAIRDKRDRIFGVVIVLHDVTQLERTSRELIHQARHDPLTGLLNRRAFKAQLEETLGDTRLDGRPHSLCYFDLDQFKLINDSCGHHAGDAMLRQLATKMAALLRPEDVMARLGGDEFGIVFHNTDLDNARNITDRLCQWLTGFHFEWDNKIFSPGGSFGLCLFDETSASADELLRRADSACYLAKRRGRNQVCVYQHDSHEARMRDFEIEHMQQINQALSKDDFILYAQPIVPVAANHNNRHVIAELLLRKKNDPGFTSPQELLLTAERYSVASHIDQWVIEHALELIAQHQGGSVDIGSFSINISGQSITNNDFVSLMQSCIERTRVDPSRLVFEVTETAAVNNLRHAANLIHTLRSMGCRFAIDDFGSGATSINYLKQLPSDLVKIDGGLVHNIVDDAIDEFIIETICRMSQTTGHLTVAEHVETREQQEILERTGVDYIQGFHIARPLPFEQYINWLKAGSRAPVQDQAVPLARP